MRTFLFIIINFLLFHGPLFGQTNSWLINVRESTELSDVYLERLDGDMLIVSKDGEQNSVSLLSIERMSKKGSNKNHAANIISGTLLGAGTAFMTYRMIDARSNPNTSDDDGTTEGAATAVGGLIGGIIGIAASMSHEVKVHELGNAGVEEKRRVVRSILVKEGKEPVAVDSPRDILYLKNGSIIKGTVLEFIPDSAVKIQTADSSLFVFRMSEVEKVTKEQGNSSTQAALPQKTPGMDMHASLSSPRVSVGLRVGIAPPIGDFGKTSGSTTAGAAKLGFCFGGEVAYSLGENVQWLSSVMLSFNNMDENAVRSSFPPGVNVDAGSWVSVWPMTGLRVVDAASQGVALYGDVQIGALFGNTPRIDAAGGGGYATQPSSSATAFAFGIGAGLFIGSHFSFRVQYQYGEPEYNITASGSAGTFSGKFSQPTGMVQITAGWMF